MTSAPQSGLSVPRLALLDRAIQEKYINSGALPGAQIMVWRRGELRHSTTFGAMDLARGKPMCDDAIFRIYSMTKPITAVALLMLVEEGKLRLGDEVAQHIPAWKNLKVFVSGSLGAFVTKEVERPMRVIDLATHTSGLSYGWLSQTAVGEAYRAIKVDDRDTLGGLRTMIDQLGELPLECAPGERWNYSVSTTVLGYLVEKISGTTFGEFLRTKLFEPLGMTDTDFFCPPAKLDRLACCYVASDTGGPLALQDDAANSMFASPPKLESGGGGLVSTSKDYLQFCRMLLNGGSLDGSRILSPKTVRLLSTNFLPGNLTIPAMGGFAEFAGAGMSIACATTLNVAERLVQSTPGDFSWLGAAATHFWVDPIEDLAVVFMAQVLESPHLLVVPDILRSLVYGAFEDTQDFIQAGV